MIHIFLEIVKNLIRERFPIAHTGRPRASIESILNGVLYVLKTGCPWRYLKKISYTSWQTVHRHFVEWSRQNLFQRAYQHLVAVYIKRFGKRRQRLITDCSYIKNIAGRDCVGPCPVDRGRSATKLSVICDDVGVVLAASFHRGNKCDYKAFFHTLTQSRVVQGYAKSKVFLADRAYDNRRCDHMVSSIGMVNQCTRRGTREHPIQRHRAVVEHVFAWLDKFRRIMVRYEQHIPHFKSFTTIALAFRLTKVLGSDMFGEFAG